MQYGYNEGDHFWKDRNVSICSRVKAGLKRQNPTSADITVTL